MRICEKLSARTQNADACAPVLIAFIGDSVTHGCFEVYMDHRHEIGIVYESDSAYPYRLKRRLESFYPAGAVSILNAGVSGEGAAQGATRIERDVLSRKPDLTVIAFALNDSMNTDVAAGLTTYRESMRTMIRKVLESGSECIVLTPNHMCSYVPSAVREPELREIAAQAANVQNEGILAQFVQAARETAAACGVPVADAYRVWDALAQNGVDTTAMLSNNINHPTREAQDIFVAELMKTVFEY